MTERVERRLAVILNADVVGYTRLMHADEEGTLERVRAQRLEIVEPRVGAQGGRVFKLMGDGLLAEFPSVVDAVQCASEIQETVAAHNADLPEAERIVLRIGVNLGDVLVDADDVFGDGVNVATRMQQIAQPGGVAVSGLVYDSVRDKLPAVFEKMPPQQVKSLDEPVRAYALAPFGGAAVVADVDWSEVPVLPPEDVPASGSILAILGSSERRGAWRVPRKLKIVSFMGSVELDFREAEFGPGVTEVEVLSVMGSVQIIAPTHIDVDCDGIGILGSFASSNMGKRRHDAAAPMLRIRGLSVMGDASTR